MFQSRTPLCFAQPAVPGGFNAWMPLLPAPNYRVRKKKEKLKKHVITGNRNRKETWRTLQRPGAEFGLTPLSCSLACEGGRVAAGSGGLFIAKLLYQTPGSSLFSCCCCLVGCRCKLDCRRCGELPGVSLPYDCSHRGSNEISATLFIFFNYKKPARKSSLMSQGGTVSSFCVFLYILPPLLSTVCLSRVTLLLKVLEQTFNHYVEVPVAANAIYLTHQRSHTH